MTISRRLTLAVGGVALAAGAVVAATQVGAGADTKPIVVPQVVVERAEVPVDEAPAVPEADTFVEAPGSGTFDLTPPSR